MPLSSFSPHVRDWFAGAFERPTPAQEQAWPAIAGVALAGGVFAYAVVMVTATSTGKYGKHLLQALGGG